MTIVEGGYSLMHKGCWICHKAMDKYCLWSTPDGKKYKLCRNCLANVKKLEATDAETSISEIENDN